MMRQSSLSRGSLPQIHISTKSLGSAGDERKQRARSSSYNVGYDMGKIHEEHEVQGNNTNSPLKKSNSAKKVANITTRRNSVATVTTFDKSKKLPVMIRNNDVALRKYSCPELRTGIAYTQETKQKPIARAKSSDKHFHSRSFESDEAQTPQGKKQIKQDKDVLTKVSESPCQESSKSKLTSAPLPKLHYDTLDEIQSSRRIRISSTKCSKFSQGVEQQTNHCECANSLFSDTKRTCHEDNFSLLSYSSNAKKTQRTMTSPKPTSNRDRSSIIVWLKEINSYQ